MVYVYCRRASESAVALAKAIDGTRLRRFDGMNFWRRGKRLTIAPSDIIVCWGDAFPVELGDTRVLNGCEVDNKYEVARLLAQNSIPTVRVSKEAHQGWLGRRYNHVGGNDLLTPTTRPDYWVEKLNLVNEYRIHSFDGKSIRAGIKRLRDGFTLEGGGGTTRASSWVRSYDGGWRICYDGFQSTKRLRAVAHKAVKALGLTFGAVDIGENQYGDLVVLEVNRAPGLEGNSIDSYARAIKRWIEGAPSEEIETGESNGILDGQSGRSGGIESPASEISLETARERLAERANRIRSRRATNADRAAAARTPADRLNRINRS